MTCLPLQSLAGVRAVSRCRHAGRSAAIQHGTLWSRAIMSREFGVGAVWVLVLCKVSTCLMRTCSSPQKSWRPFVHKRVDALCLEDLDGVALGFPILLCVRCVQLNQLFKRFEKRASSQQPQAELHFTSKSSQFTHPRQRTAAASASNRRRTIVKAWALPFPP